MDVREIIKAGLISSGSTGLAFWDGYDGCGSGISDLIPCGESPMDCEPAYEVPCTPACEHEDFDYEPGNTHFQRNKPAWPPVDPSAKTIPPNEEIR